MRKLFKLLLLKPYVALLVSGFTLWVIETCAFGINERPESFLEAILDTAAFIMMFWGVLGDLLSNLYVIKVENPDKNFQIRTILSPTEDYKIIKKS